MGYRSMLMDIAGIALAAARQYDGVSEKRPEYQWAALMWEAGGEARERGASFLAPQAWLNLLHDTLAKADGAASRGNME